jgi:hypothetical protein
MGYNDFVRNFWQVYDYLLRDKEQRRGQARMNALSRTDPELYQMITGTDIDCFYRDDLIPEFDNAVFGTTYPGR